MKHVPPSYHIGQRPSLQVCLLSMGQQGQCPPISSARCVVWGRLFCSLPARSSSVNASPGEHLVHYYLPFIRVNPDSSACSLYIGFVEESERCLSSDNLNPDVFVLERKNQTLFMDLNRYPNIP